MYTSLYMNLLMDSSAPYHDLCSPLTLSPPNDLKNDEFVVFDIAKLQKQENLPKQFIWPEEDLVHSQAELKEPLVNLEGYFKDDEVATITASELVKSACQSHGFFQVIHHGVEADLIKAAHEHMDSIFNLPLGKKLEARKDRGCVIGYSGAHAHRYSDRLPWKETLSFTYKHGDHSHHDFAVVKYFTSAFGKEFQETGLVYQKYCEAMENLSLAILELLAISLGVERSYYKRFFEDAMSIMRCNNYPPCKESRLTLGTGPHCDPNSLTILHQDGVGGLEVFANNEWRIIKPRPDALVVNIGDTFMALSNGNYRSCIHRAVVNKKRVRRSLAFFLCPKGDKVVRAPEDLIDKEGRRKYPDFTWSDLQEFTLKHYRSDASTLQNFIHHGLLAKQAN